MKKLFMLLILLLVSLMFIVGCEQQQVSKEDVWLTAKDGIKLKASVLYADNDKSVILAHMLGSDKTSWSYFSKKLNRLGFTVLSLDLRGHGESEGDWNGFNDEDFNRMVYDIEAAKKFLNQKDRKSIAVIGASIGANVALKYAASDSSIKAVVLLSPGLNYKGISIESDIESFSIPSLIIVSKEDSYPYESSNIIYEKLAGKKELYVAENLGHGTDMIPKSEELQNKIFEFLSQNLG
jgi:pimeloyl-ACP methyl ester carboxylesterase